MNINQSKIFEKKIIDLIEKHSFNYWKKIAIDFLKNNGESRIIAQKIIESYLKSVSIKNNNIEKNKITVSVIIPCHNYGKYLKDAVISVMKQTFKDIEIIIINDGSTDDTHNIILELISSFPNYYISYINQYQSGIVQPRNRGVSTARGKYILPLDADDMIAPQFLEKTVNILETHPELGYVSTKALFFGDTNKIWPRAEFNSFNILVTNQQTNTTLYRKKMWQEIGGYDERMINGYMDWEFWIRATKYGWIGTQIDEPLFFYRRKENSVVMKAKNKDIDIKIQIMHLHPEIYDVKNINSDNPELHRKNWIPPILLKKDIKIISKKASDNLESSPTAKPSNLKILFICHDFPPHRYAGAQIYAKNLAHQLIKDQNIHIEILYPVVRPPSPQNYTIGTKKYQKITVHELYKPIASEPEKVFDQKVYNICYSFLEKNKYDLIHFHGFGQITLAPIFAAHELKICSILTLHDYWMLCDQWHLIKPNKEFCEGPDTIDKCTKCFYQSIEISQEQYETIKNYKIFRSNMMHKAFKMFNKVYAPSHFLAKRFGQYGFGGIETIPIGLLALPSVTQGPASEQIEIGFAGQIIPRKGLDFLVQAFKKMSPNQVRLHIWGSIQDENYGRRILDSIANIKNIIYHGSFEPKDLSSIYEKIDIAVIPSLMENYPITVLEAFAYKKPVIASNVGGIPEIVDHNKNGLLVPPKNIEALFIAMQKIIDKKVYNDFIQNIPKIPTISSDAQRYAREYKKNFSRKNVVHQKHKIMFYFFKNVHIPIMTPVLKKWQQLYPDTKIAIGYMPYAPQIRAGFESDELEQIKQFGLPMYEQPQEFAPDLTFIADSVYPWVQGCGKLVHIGHGLLSKGQYYTDTETARREQQADLVCVPGKHHQKIMRKIISKPVMATGMAKLDPLFSGQISRESVIAKYGLPENKKYILFAPTFNDELSAIPYVTDKIGEVIPDQETLLLIKLHGSTKKKYKNMYRHLPAKEPRVIYADELDITPFLALADVMISDISSTMFEFAALDKPVILFDSPDWEKYENYNPDDIEFTWRDFALRVKNLKEMKDAVKKSLEDPEELSKLRIKYTKQILTNYNSGNAAERIVRAGYALLNQ